MTTQVLAPAGIQADIGKIQDALDEARSTHAGEGTFVRGYITLHVRSTEEVDRIAAQWGVTAEWSGGQYRAGITRPEVLLCAAFIPSPGKAAS